MRYLKKFNENNKEFLQDIEDFAKDCFIDSIDNNFILECDQEQECLFLYSDFDKNDDYSFYYKDIEEDLLKFLELKIDYISNVIFYFLNSSLEVDNSPSFLIKGGTPYDDNPKKSPPHDKNTKRSFLNHDDKFRLVQILFKPDKLNENFFKNFFKKPKREDFVRDCEDVAELAKDCFVDSYDSHDICTSMKYGELFISNIAMNFTFNDISEDLIKFIQLAEDIRKIVKINIYDTLNDIEEFNAIDLIEGKYEQGRENISYIEIIF